MGLLTWLRSLCLECLEDRISPVNYDIFFIPRQETSGTSATGVLSGMVFLEGNRMGFAANGPAVADVILVLEVEQNGKFVPVAVTVTDATGAYSFTGLPAGNYRVRALGRLRVGAKLGRNLIITIQGENGARTADAPEIFASGEDFTQ